MKLFYKLQVEQLKMCTALWLLISKPVDHYVVLSTETEDFIHLLALIVQYEMSKYSISNSSEY